MNVDQYAEEFWERMSSLSEDDLYEMVLLFGRLLQQRHLQRDGDWMVGYQIPALKLDARQQFLIRTLQETADAAADSAADNG